MKRPMTHAFRYVRLTLLATLCLGATACGDLVRFDTDASGQTTVQGDPLGGLITLPSQFSGLGNINLSSNSNFRNNNTDKDHIDTCRFSHFGLKVVSPSGQDLSFLSQVSFSITAPNLPKVRVAHLESFPTGATSVDLTLDDVDIAAYAKSDTFSITTDATGHAPKQNTTVEADLTLHIEASIL
ncbi:MAG: hypothetical protein JST92_08765 [Deltaproteobacteria bacterium]|nr:hypothetical protein [Deltaproteobacteria bacterium]